MKKLSKIKFWLASIGLALIIIWVFYTRPFEARVLKFPHGFSLGELWVIEDVNCFTCGNGEKFVGEARGQINVSIPKKHWFVKLVMSLAGIQHLTALKNLDPSSIEAISFAGIDLDDADLSAISHFRLRDLDLAETPISGTGLSHLKNRAAWLSISFRSARRLDPRAFDALLGQNQISINLWRSNLDDRQFICELRRRMCDVIKPKKCYVRIRGSHECGE